MQWQDDRLDRLGELSSLNTHTKRWERGAENGERERER